MSNPFEAPLAPAGGPPAGIPGDFDLGRAFSDGWEAMKRNWLVWLGAMIVAGFTGMLSIAACLLPALAVIPVLSWGTTRFNLDMLDGEAEVGTVFAGFSKFADTWGPMFVYGIAALLLASPGIVVSLVFQFGGEAVAEGNDLVIALFNLLGQFISTAWSVVVMSRFLPGMYLVVEQGRSATDAIGEAWQLTAGCWGKLILFQVLTILATIAGFLACCVGVFPAMIVITVAQASVYRQLLGR